MIHPRHFKKLNRLLVILVLLLAFYIAFIPHQSYPLPLHVDEWVHIAFAQDILISGDLPVSDPFYETPLRARQQMEFGFQLSLGIFHLISDVS
jgi:hypothetical protein